MRPMLIAWWVDLRLYRRLAAMQVRAQWQYRANVAIDIGTYALLTALEYAAVVLYFSRFPSIAGWRVGEVTLLAALVSLGYGMAELIGAGIDGFAKIIRLGEFDRVLLRPIGTLWQVVGSDLRLRRLGRIGQGILLFPLALHLLPGLRWSTVTLLLVPIAIVTNALLFVAIMLIGATICFWTIETTELIHIPVDGGRELSNYPLTIYPTTLQRLFVLVIPLAFGAYLPACAILGRPLPLGMPSWIVWCGPVIALVFAALTLRLWQFGVRHYQSTGS